MKNPNRMAKTLRAVFAQGGWELQDEDGLRVASLSGILIDGSNTGEYPDGVMRSRQAQAEHAKRLADAYNAMFGFGMGAPVK